MSVVLSILGNQETQLSLVFPDYTVELGSKFVEVANTAQSSELEGEEKLVTMAKITSNMISEDLISPSLQLLVSTLNSALFFL